MCHTNQTKEIAIAVARLREGWKMNFVKTTKRRAFDIRHSTFVILWAFATANAQSGGGYLIKKSTIDSGGGTVTGGAYRLSGTVGQHDAGPISGGNYLLRIWSKTTSRNLGRGID